MAEIVLFHHVLGLSPGVQAFADELRAAGHRAHADEEVMRRGLAAADALPADVTTPASRWA